MKKKILFILFLVYATYAYAQNENDYCYDVRISHLNDSLKPGNIRYVDGNITLHGCYEFARISKDVGVFGSGFLLLEDS